jgi:menaquinone-dependent protoporphyrinogen IX oxidase
VIEAGSADPSADHYSGVIVAASVHGGTYQRPVLRWVQQNREALAGRPTAFISVCLAVLQWQLHLGSLESALNRGPVAAIPCWG